MKKTILVCSVCAAFVLPGCKSETKEGTAGSKEKLEDTLQVQSAGSSSGQVSAFDVNALPLSTADLGDFPFFTAPEGAQYINRAQPSDFDFIVFVTPDDIFEVEGKTFRAHVHGDRNSETKVSGRYLVKSFEDAIQKAGGVKVYEGRLKDDRLDKYKDMCTYAGSNGSIDVWNNEIATYVIRREEGNIYIAMDKGKSNTTSIQIVQEAPFQQTIKKVTSDEIAKDLTEKGKSVLYINFDVDKATVTSEGKEVVGQIAEALKKKTSLQVRIEGHTDNTGSADHNKALSNDRAHAVMAALVENGIDASRLKALGFGSEKPLVANDTEDNKAKNRRVELIRVD